MTADATGEPRKVMCPYCEKVFTTAAFYGRSLTAVCPWCLSTISIMRK